MKSEGKRKDTYRILAHGFEPVTNAIEQGVELRFILLIVKFPTSLAKMVGLIIAVRLENITRLEKNLTIIRHLKLWKDKRRATDFANVNIDRFEPLSESWILAAIINEDVGSVEDNVHGNAIGESFEKSAQLGNCKVEIRILGE